MTNRISTKRALLTSFMALLLCFTMLLGTTYAWFTDSVTSEGNKIQAGTLKIDLELFNGTEYVSIKESKAPIFDYDLWEPGYVDVKLLKVENEGTLALKWKATFVAYQALSALANVIDVYVLPSATELSMPADRSLAGYTKVGTVAEFVSTIEATTVGTLNPNTVTDGSNVAYLGIALKMQESAGNEYQGLDLGAFDIQILATQLTYEADSFDENYDQGSLYPLSGVGYGNYTGGTIEFDIRETVEPGNPNNTKVGYAKIPAAAFADPEKPFGVSITEKDEAVITVAADKQAKSYDVSVSNHKAGENVTITIDNVGVGLTGVKLYHEDEEIPYDSYSGGNITFTYNDFSPFTVVADAVAAEITPDATLPEATVSEVTLAEPIVWETGYGDFKPGDLTQQLDVVFNFKAPHDPISVQTCEYREWICDYYVMLKTPSGTPTTLPAASITLGGNYGEWGWIGFDNPEVDTDTFIPLLGSVLGSWTYADVVGLVEEFLCGVAVANANQNYETFNLNGAEFVVQLRLTDPEDDSNYFVTNEVTYTFPAK